MEGENAVITEIVYIQVAIQYKFAVHYSFNISQTILKR